MIAISWLYDVIKGFIDLYIEKRTIHQPFGVGGPIIQLELENIIYLHITISQTTVPSSFKRYLTSELHR